MYEEDEQMIGDDRDLFGKREARQHIKSVLLAIMLMLCGAALLTLGTLVYLGKLDIGANDQSGQGSYPLFIVGGVTFLPGIYHVRIACYAWYEAEGFDFNEIPEF